MKGAGGPIAIPERYEMKFTVPAEQVEAISAFVEPYCALDYHSSISPDRFYQVNSLYLDSPDHIFLRNRMDRVHDRFNMRVRTYGAEPDGPWYLEVKRKVGDIIRKYRARVKGSDLEATLDPAAELADCLAAPGDAAHAALFRRLVHVYNARPQVLTTYRRKAYFSTCDDYARVTFDVGLRFMDRDTYDPLPVEGAFAPSDLETLYDEGSSVILELKCVAKQVPLWMVDLVRCFELRRRGFSKYGAGMSQVFRKYEFDRGGQVPTASSFTDGDFDD